MAKKPINVSPFKDGIVSPSGGASDYAGAQLVGGDLEINGQKPVIQVDEGAGAGLLAGYLRELE